MKAIFKKLLKIHLLIVTLLCVSCRQENNDSDQNPDTPTKTEKAYAGIICLVSNALANPSEAFDMPYVDGVKLRLGWRNVEQSNNNYDWTLIDKYVSEAELRDKQLSISIAGGSTSPQWLIDMLDSSEFIISRGNAIPNLWNETYVTEYIDFVKAFGNRYANNQYVSHITMSGIGFSNEPVIPSPFGLDALEEWAIASNRIINSYIDYFPNKPISLAVHTQIPNEDTWDFFKEYILLPLYQKSEIVGLEYHGLDATASPTEGTIADNYYQEISQLNAYRTAGYQFVCSTIGNQVCEPSWVNGSSNDTDQLLYRTLEAGIANGADFIEVYANDCKDSANFEILENTSIKLKE